jgi:aminopeptidase N
MENPRLSFISPSVVAGDRSLVSTVVHELAHSWSGNLVTMATWNDFWLNEGFTSYLERRMSEEIYGKRFADMVDVVSYGELRQAIEDLNAAGRAKDSDPRSISRGGIRRSIRRSVREAPMVFLGFLEGRFGRPAFDAFLRE